MSDSYPSLYSDPERYDLVEGAFAEGKFLEFYLRQIALYGEPVLELACGSGRLTIPLAEAGMRITGLDNSKDMLALATSKASDRGVELPLVPGDMRNFYLDQEFKFIFVAAQSLTHLHTRREIEDCFSCVRRHLVGDGRFLLELFNPSVKLLARDPGKRYRVGEYEDQKAGKRRVSVTEEVRYDAATQISRILWFFRDERAVKAARSFEMRQFFPQEIDALLVYNGFLIDRKYGDYDENQFGHDSPKQLIVCRGEG